LIGKLKKESQKLSLEKRIGCHNKTEIIIHELVHALGFDHEQNRPDRDDYVEIIFENIQTGEKNYDFQKLEPTEFQDLKIPYDYESIMHYSSFNDHSINKNLPTMKAIKPPFAINPNNTLSTYDIMKIRKLYNCKSGN
jgi:hypothetical protein